MKTRISKRMFSLLLVLIMLVSIIPTPAVAADTKLTSTTTNSNTGDGVFMQKTSTYDPATGMMDITIEAYTTGSVQSTIRTVPTDIVLLLDLSTSMNTQRMNAMKNAVNSFIDSTLAQNESIANDADKHSIAMVKFASPAFYSQDLTAVGNHRGGNFGFGNSNSVFGNYTETIADFTVVDQNGSSALKQTVNSLSSGGYTAVDYGLQIADALLGERKSANNGAYSERNKVIIVFADGAPAHSGAGQYSAQAAHNAIDEALPLKTNGIKIFTIGIFDGADSNDTSGNENKFMNYLSSNYPKAYGSNTGTTIYPGDEPHYNTYYHGTDTDGLASVFQSISASIGAPQIELGESAAIVDVVSDYFTIPETVGGNPSISVYTSDYMGGSNFNDASKWTTPVAATGVTASLDSDRDTVSVTGFDYDSNYLSATARDGGFYGRKLILKISAAPNYKAIDEATEAGKITGGIIPTNDSGSLQASDGNAAAWVTAPELQANTVTYKVITGDNETITHTYYRFPGGKKQLIEKPTDTAEHSYGDWETDDTTITNGAITMPHDDVEIISTATVKTYDITFEYITNVPAGASPLPDAMTNKAVGTSITLPTITVPAGYKFEWKEVGDDAVGPTFAMPAQDLHFVGGFTAQPTGFKVEHYLANVDGSYPTTPAAENVLSLSANTDSTVTARLATHHGYSYDEAATRANQQAGVSMPTTAGDDMPSATVKADGSTVLKLYYKRNPHTLTYVYEGTVPAGAPAVPQGGTYPYGKEVQIADKPVVAGYTFDGWTVRTGATSTTVSTVTMRDADLTLYGSFTASEGTKYTVKHYFETLTSDGNLGNKANFELHRTDEKTGTTDSTVTAAYISDVIGFEYEPGYSTATGTVKGDGTLVLELYYSRTKHTVSYQYLNTVPENASALPATVTYKYGETVTVAPNATAKGYTFSGWNRSGNFTMPAENVVISGQFSPAANKYVVEHYVMNPDGTWPTSTDHKHTYEGVKTGDIVTATISEHSGFTYDEAKTITAGSQPADVSIVTNTDGKKVPQATVKADSSTVLRLYYSRNKYSVTYTFDGFVPDGATVPVDNNTYFFEQTVSLKDRPNIPGYTFNGWSIKEFDTSISSDNTMKMPRRNVTLRGSFTANSGTKYTVEHYYENAGSTNMNDPANYTINEAYTIYGSGTTGETAIAAVRSDLGFQYEAGLSNVTGTIAGDGSLVLKVYYSRARHNVTYQYSEIAPEGAPAVPEAKEYKYGDTVTVAAAPSLTGYEFSGWSTEDANAAGGTFTMPAEEVEFFGYFYPASNKYTVYVYEMDTNGNYPTDTDHVHTYTDVKTGDTVTATISVITGLTYDETKTTAVGSQNTDVEFVEVNGKQVPTAKVAADGNTVLKLYFKRNQHTVSYEYLNTVTGASSLPASATYYYGQEVTIAPDATAPGYKFTGWSIRTGDTSIVGGKMIMPDSNVVIRGAFNAEGKTAYKVEHYFEDLDGNYILDSSKTESLTGQTDTDAIAVPLSGSDITGFTFNATKSENTRHGKIAGDGSLVLMLYYDRSEHTVTYQYTGHVPATALPGYTTDSNGAQIIDSYTAKYRYGETVEVKPIASAPGYSFDGWTPRTRLTIDGDGEFTMPAGDITFTGHFTAVANKYTVEHYLMGTDGKYPSTASHSNVIENVVTDQTVTANTAVSHEGFTFDSSAPNVLFGTVAANGSTVLKLYFKRNQYTVSYEYENSVPGASTLPAAKQYYFEEMVPVAPDATAPGYIFNPWHIHTPDTSIEGGFMKMPSHDVVIYGAFNADPNTPYTVEHYWEKVDSSNHNDTANYTLFATEQLSGTTGSPVYAETISDERVLGFSYNEALSAPTVKGTIAADGKLVLKLYYKRMDSVIKYQFTGSVPTGAVLPADVSTTYGATATVAPAPSVQGYTFHGWFNELNLSITPDNRFSVPAVPEIIFSGRFTADSNKYRVEHYLMDTNGNYPAQADHFYEITNVVTDQAVSVSTEVDHVGFTFDSAAPNVLSGIVAADGSTVLKVYFKRNQFSVSYQYDGTVPAGASTLPVDNNLYYFEQEVTLAPNASAVGYIFTGWSIHTGDTVITGDKMAMPNSNVILYGAFNADPNTPYTVEHYLELLDNTPDTVDYPAVPDRTVTKSGKTGTSVHAEPLSDEGLLGFDYDTASVAEGVIAADGSLVIKLYYKRTVNPVVYEYVGVVPAGAPAVPAAENYKYGTEVSVAADPVLPGYTFSGWEPWDTTVVNVTGGKFPMPQRPVYFHGSFSANPSGYTVNYFLQNPDGSYPTTPASSDTFNVGINVDEVVTAIPVTTYRTYSYDEAMTTAAGSQSAGVTFVTVNGVQAPQGTVNAAGTLTLNLYYSRNDYDLSYKFTGTVPDGAAAPAAQTDIKHGAVVALASPTVPAGYDFDGWYHGTAKVGSTLTMPAADTVVTGSFSAKTDVKYSVEYYLEKLDGSYELDRSAVYAGTTGSYVAAPRVDFTGFTFNMAKSEWNGHVKGDGTLVLKLYYDRNVHTVSYHYHGEEPAGVVLPAAKDYKYGETFTVEAGLAATAPDVFRGWYTPSVSGVSSTTENTAGTVMTMPDHDVVFYGALFSYSVSYDLAGGTLNGADTVASREVAWDEADLIPAGTPEKEDHDFIGWTYLEAPVTASHKYSDLALNYTVVNIVLVANYSGSTPVTPPAPPAPTTGSAKLVKVDAADTSTVLADVVFKLFAADGTELGSYTTNSKGEINISDLEPGSYYWQELLPAEGYTVDSTHREFTVTAGKTASVTVTNARTPIPPVFSGDHYAYIIGYEDGMVHPEKNITRAEVATIFFRLLDDDVRTESMTRENPFSDVNEGNWFNTAVSTMCSLGILNGYEDGTFRPNAPITRAEFAAIAARFDTDGDASDTIFKDIYEHWGRREINIAANNGWVLGYEDGTFKPNDLVTRAEAMAMVNRVLQRIPQSSADLLSDMIKWPDNQNTAKWYYMVIQEATNSHNYTRKESGYEKWTSMREGRDWDTIEK